MVLPTVVNVVLALLPRVVMAAMHTTMIRAGMTGYWTAVGPSSRFRNFTMFFMDRSFFEFGLGECRVRVTAHSAGGGADGVADGGERGLGVVAQGGDGGDAHHDDQGQHDRVLDGRRAVLTLQELHGAVGELLHGDASGKQD